MSRPKRLVSNPRHVTRRGSTARRKSGAVPGGSVRPTLSKQNPTASERRSYTCFPALLPTFGMESPAHLPCHEEVPKTVIGHPVLQAELLAASQLDRSVVPR